MIIIDRELQKRQGSGKPIRVALIGAGYSGRNIAYQIVNSMPGMRLVGIANRTLNEASRAYKEAGIENPKPVETVNGVEDGIRRGQYMITQNATILCEADEVDAVVEATGEVDFGSIVAMKGIKGGKHVIVMNAEMDATVGPILKVYADRAGVIFTNTDGDEPGVAMNMCRFVTAIGFTPVLAGNLKGFYDCHRTPETQKDFAEKNHQKPRMMTSFVDGTKLSMELAVLANATGFKVGRRGMYGPRCAHVKEALNVFNLEECLKGGMVDYLLGAEPGTGAFVVGYSDQPVKQQYMKYLKMGAGPFYVFYTPFHLPHLELPLTVARAVLFRDATVTPKGGPVCEVVTMAKRDIKAGEILDGIGGFTCYGMLDNTMVTRKENLLPMGLSKGCRVIKDIEIDKPINYTDVEVPTGRYCDQLYAEQNLLFPVSNIVN
jgi:predicted homoserine dehydrogenase-like protein